jgi:hypothetical protein
MKRVCWRANCWKRPSWPTACREGGSMSTAPKTVAEIEQDLRDNVLSIARQCLPGGREEGNYYAAGDLTGGAGGSLVVNLKGARQGRGAIMPPMMGGDMLDLIERTQGLAGKGAAVALAKEWLGIDDGWGGRVTSISPEERAARARRQAEMRSARPKRQRRGPRRSGRRGAFI